MKFFFKISVIQIIIQAFLLFLILYPSFHYILKYTQSTTSPRYMDVPFIWQFSKYIGVLIFAILIFLNVKFQKRIRKYIIYSSTLFIGVILFNLMLLIIGNPNINELKYIYFFIVLSPILLLNKDSIIILQKNLESFIDIAILYFILTNIYIIINFYFFDRLPAQAYPGTFIIRFAGLWDMPNAFGFINVFLLYITLLKGYTVRSFFLVFNIILTLSLSSYLGLLFILFFYLKKKKKILIGLLIFLIIFIPISIYFVDIIYDLYQSKSGSIGEHLRLFFSYPFFSVIEGKIYFNESFTQSFLYNYFPFSFLLILIVLYIGVLNLNTIYGVYILLFFIINLIIPQMYIFPNNIFFIIFLYILMNKNYTRRKNNV